MADRCHGQKCRGALAEPSSLCRRVASGRLKLHAGWGAGGRGICMHAHETLQQHGEAAAVSMLQRDAPSGSKPKSPFMEPSRWGGDCMPGSHMGRSAARATMQRPACMHGCGRCRGELETDSTSCCSKCGEWQRHFL